MLEEFIDFVNSVLPSVDPEARDKAKAAIAQFSNDGNQYEFLLSNLLPQLSQGDIISEIPFVYLKDNGEQEIYKAKGRCSRWRLKLRRNFQNLLYLKNLERLFL